MKSRIFNNKFQGIYSDEFISINLSNVINGQLVSKWQLSKVLPSEDLINPVWNGTQFIEGTPEKEIQEKKEFELKEKKQEQYNELLKTDWYFTRLVEKGIEVPKEIIEQRELIRNR